MQTQGHLCYYMEQVTFIRAICEASQ